MDIPENKQADIRRMREDFGLSYQALADMFGTSLSTVQRIITGRAEDPKRIAARERKQRTSLQMLKAAQKELQKVRRQLARKDKFDAWELVPSLKPRIWILHWPNGAAPNMRLYHPVTHKSIQDVLTKLRKAEK